MMTHNKKCVFVTWVCTTLLLSCMFTNVDARKYASSSRKSSSKTSHSHGTSSSSSGGHANKPDTSHADAAKLSYSGYNSQPNPPRTAHQPSAPAAPAHTPAAHASAPDANKPIGWNVPASNSNAGGIQKQTASNTNSAYPGK